MNVPLDFEDLESRGFYNLVRHFPRLCRIQPSKIFTPAVMSLPTDIQLTNSLNHDHTLIQENFSISMFNNDLIK